MTTREPNYEQVCRKYMELAAAAHARDTPQQTLEEFAVTWSNLPEIAGIDTDIVIEHAGTKSNSVEVTLAIGAMLHNTNPTPLTSQCQHIWRAMMRRPILNSSRLLALDHAVLFLGRLADRQRIIALGLPDASRPSAKSLAWAYPLALPQDFAPIPVHRFLDFLSDTPRLSARRMAMLLSYHPQFEDEYGDIAATALHTLPPPLAVDLLNSLYLLGHSLPATLEPPPSILANLLEAWVSPTIRLHSLPAPCIPPDSSTLASLYFTRKSIAPVLSMVSHCSVATVPYGDDFRWLNALESSHLDYVSRPVLAKAMAVLPAACRTFLMSLLPLTDPDVPIPPCTISAPSFQVLFLSQFI